ncbi:MAG TPA: hypothetical protein VIS56_02120 [Candidatus Saccharimonadales bacterium]
MTTINLIPVKTFLVEEDNDGQTRAYLAIETPEGLRFEVGAEVKR